MDDNNFDYMHLDEDNIADLGRSIYRNELYGIISENDGGIIAYAIGRDHANAIVRALNTASGEYEAEMVSAKGRYE